MANPTCQLAEAFQCRPLRQVFKDRVEDRNSQQCEDQTEGLSPNHKYTNRTIRGSARSAADNKRKHTGYQGDGGHQDWSQPVPICTHDCFVPRHAGCSQTVCVIDLQNCVLLNDAKQKQQA